MTLQAIAGAAKNKAEDLELTLKIIMDHAERSTTASKDQFLSEMEQQQSSDDDAEPVDVSVPYDAPAALAYEKAGSPGDYEAFKTQYEADAVAAVKAKQTPAVSTSSSSSSNELDISVPYDAPARLAYEKAGSPGDYAEFKSQCEAQAVADVTAKQQQQKEPVAA